MAKRYIFTNGTATTTEQQIEIAVGEVFFVSNDEESGGDLYLDFYDSMDIDTNYIVVKPGEQFEGLDIPCKTLYFKSSDGDVKFRCYGKKN